MTTVHNNIKTFKRNGRPYIIAGPCSAETEEQVLTAARTIAKNSHVDLFRAGIWKPRTRPDSFEGVGEKGLKWLKKVQSETGLPVTVEVANAKHVELALAAGVDVLWIGARTTVSPFAVQEIADALRGTNIPVLVKNPINPDLGLWMGALERISKAGIETLGAIHRGFSTLGGEYRNTPHWEIPIKLKTQLPDLPVITDPSHITGNRYKILDVAQKSLDLEFDGLMIETHPTPDQAWSDAAQQVTPLQLHEILSLIQIRKKSGTSTEFNTRLEELRSEIDELDAEILKKLAKRMNVVKEIGEYKRDNHVTILQLERWKEILDTRIPFGEKSGLSTEFTETFLDLIHEASIKLQTEILNQLPKTK